MTPEQRDRYDRQIRLPAITESGQQSLLDARVLIIGMGGLGSPVAMYLAAAGVGHLVLSDFDIVERSNLQRQVIHTEQTIGQLKVDSAKVFIESLNTDTQVTPLARQLSDDDLMEQIQLADAVVDCTDNFPSRFELNRCCIKAGKPLVSGAAIRQEGQISTYDLRVENSPCYQCLYPDIGIESVTCAMEGVLAPVVGIIGTMQAQETINVLLGRPALIGKLLLLDAQHLEWQRMQLPKNPNCPACSGAHS
ncbi:HesA/MoeB/ThiF family protein [Leucothrix pacifica]|uniref:Molybdopterin-synthase adenylyltransferase n=1 Tax=Leucothrix pacifica TaxID=1247513 RepID=A0A317CSP5_9GAMM|nr:molybdopterin-synthase adenylyltransferase MoeB [Leucothrix pacifica]PWR00554.1 molybdopterin-synthase adenylyltransferase MoeB [Leucothrix pacifica]